MRPNAVAINMLDGSVVRLSSHEIERASVLADGPSPFDQKDLGLIKKGVAALSPIAEKERELVKEQARDLFEHSGAIAIMPTERCNFRCAYCYETFSRGRMSPELVSGVLKLIERLSNSLRSLNLSWFGGEPLLAADIVENVTRSYRDAQSRKGFLGSAGITTNGALLIPGLVNRLESAGVSFYHISLDGPQSVHDAQRPLAGGGPTYQKVLNGIETVLSRSTATILFRINTDTKSDDAVARTCDWLVSEIFPRLANYADRIQYHVVSIWDATPTSVDGICIKDAERVQRWLAVKDVIAHEAGSDLLPFIAAQGSGLGKLSCYAGRPNNYLIGADGTIYRCSVALDLPENRIGQLFPDGSMLLDTEREDLWTRASFLSDPVCATCSFGVSCLGLHCPLVRIQSGKQPCPTEKKHLVQIVGHSRPAKPSTDFETGKNRGLTTVCQ
jgi:uncharacterized protein